MKLTREQMWYVVCILHPEMTRAEFDCMWDDNMRRRPQ